MVWETCFWILQTKTRLSAQRQNLAKAHVTPRLSCKAQSKVSKVCLYVPSASTSAIHHRLHQDSNVMSDSDSTYSHRMCTYYSVQRVKCCNELLLPASGFKELVTRSLALKGRISRPEGFLKLSSQGWNGCQFSVMLSSHLALTPPHPLKR